MSGPERGRARFQSGTESRRQPVETRNREQSFIMTTPPINMQETVMTFVFKA
jgi:hypothetical protein